MEPADSPGRGWLEGGPGKPGASTEEGMLAVSTLDSRGKGAAVGELQSLG